MRRVLTAVALGVLVSALALQPAVAGHGGGDYVLNLSAPYVKRLVDEGDPLIFVDLRPVGEFRRERLPGARSVPLKELPRRFSEVPRLGRVILYCDCVPEELHAAYRFLRDQGYRNIMVMEEGFPGWAKRGYPLER